MMNTHKMYNYASIYFEKDRLRGSELIGNPIIFNNLIIAGKTVYSTSSKTCKCYLAYTKAYSIYLLSPINIPMAT